MIYFLILSTLQCQDLNSKEITVSTEQYQIKVECLSERGVILMTVRLHNFHIKRLKPIYLGRALCLEPSITEPAPPKTSTTH